jgi:hypothetical protein
MIPQTWLIFKFSILVVFEKQLYGFRVRGDLLEYDSNSFYIFGICHPCSLYSVVDSGTIFSWLFAHSYWRDKPLCLFYFLIIPLV